MHDTSMAKMERFVNKYLDKTQPLCILDVGSMSLDGTSYKKLFNGSKWEYKGLDLSSGSNVDIVSHDLYEWPIADASYDVVVSGQVLEHVEDMHKWIKEIYRVCKYGGLVCIIAPTEWAIHRHPVDCWRILPDGMTFLLEKIGGLHMLDCYNIDKDCVGIARKPNNCWGVDFIPEDGDTIVGPDGVKYIVRLHTRE